MEVSVDSKTSIPVYIEVNGSIYDVGNSLQIYSNLFKGVVKG